MINQLPSEKHQLDNSTLKDVKGYLLNDINIALVQILQQLETIKAILNIDTTQQVRGNGMVNKQVQV